MKLRQVTNQEALLSNSVYVTLLDGVTKESGMIVQERPTITVLLDNGVKLFNVDKSRLYMLKTTLHQTVGQDYV